MSKDKTSGKPMTLILLFTLPMLVGNIFQQFYAMVDTVVVGHFIGVQALAAVGATGGIAGGFSIAGIALPFKRRVNGLILFRDTKIIDANIRIPN